MRLEKSVVSDIQNMMIKHRYIPVLTGFLLLCGVNAAGQIADNQLWSGATLKLGISKKLRFDIEEQVRFNNDISKLNITLTEGSILYDLTKKISLKGTFRYIFDPNSHNAQRITFDFYRDLSIKNFPLDFKYRLRFHREVEEHTRESACYLRNKISADYNLSKLVDPFVEFESYFMLSHVNCVKKASY